MRGVAPQAHIKIEMEKKGANLSSKSENRERCRGDRKQPKQPHIFLPHSSSFQDQSADRRSHVVTKIPEKLTIV